VDNLATSVRDSAWYNRQMKPLESLLIIVAGVTFTLLGDVCLKKSATGGHTLLGLGAVLYIAGLVPVVIAFRSQAFGTVFLVWEGATVVLALIVANVFFKEALTADRSIALVLALAALYFSYR
jgi:multidrug transporter EmrE-like cation transporter